MTLQGFSFASSFRLDQKHLRDKWIHALLGS